MSLVPVEDADLVSEGREQLEQFVSAAQNALRQSALARWSFGAHMREIEKRKLWRFADGAPTSFSDFVEHNLAWNRHSVERAIKLADAFDESTLRASDLTPSALLAIVDVTKALPPHEQKPVREKVVAEISGCAATEQEARAAAEAEVAEVRGEAPFEEAPQVRLPPVHAESVWVEESVPAQPTCSYVGRHGRPVKKPRASEIGGLVLRIEVLAGYAVEVELDSVPVARLAARGTI